MDPMFLPGVEQNPQPGPYRDPIEQMQRAGPRISADLAPVRVPADGDHASRAVHAGDPARAGAAQPRACAS